MVGHHFDLFGIDDPVTNEAMANNSDWLDRTWRSWVDLLRASAGASTVSGSIPIPFAIRLPVALLVIAWAARRDARWLLPVGVLLAMPVIWPGSLALLAGSVALGRTDLERALLARLPGRPAATAASIETAA